jgi:adenylate kinase family enzyme
MPWEEFEQALERDLDNASDGWVSDGSYSQVMHVYLSRADAIIWLHLPWRVSFWRLLKRTVRRALNQERLYNPDGPHESLRMSFLTRDSILWWSISHHRTAVRNYRARIAALPPHVRVYELKSTREVAELLSRIATAREAQQTPRRRA